jgi:acyl-CoA reductase-like NAD-dependent aldehyde dehydrogenase
VSTQRFQHLPALNLLVLLHRQVHINSVSVHDSASLPHGGHKNSGFGRFNGIHAAYTFTQTKTITLKEPADLPIFMLK